MLRVAIQGGGCSGFQYAPRLRPRRRRRATTRSSSRRHGRRRPVQRAVPRGREIDFVDGLQESGFKIDNPNVSASCGCGHSFQVDEGEAPDGSAGGCGSGCALARTLERPLRVAVVGSGPAGFYAAGALLGADPPSRST